MKGLCLPVSGLKPREFPVKLQESPSKAQFKIHKWTVGPADTSLNATIPPPLLWKQWKEGMQSEVCDVPSPSCV